ncbi:ABC transporter ATP-binding protein [Pseudidiomarina salinarum]|uniref:ABC transporter ATP-binding protein n=1 Tax=Pseudidiomarina salinarum TaxID=435908 RepID=A0A094JH25_9GAMM|nr:ABC transporter ATP-binding protein [Pseudidiomarina salinarum]RUO71534.1 ABC transporter ATP-binding protein [Pseudidiomarina salinarum]
MKADNLTRRFGPITAVDGLSLSIEKAQVYGFLGPNGSGKSTAIRMLCGLLKPTAGTVSVLGFELPEQADAVRSRIGYMTQEFSLYEDMTVLENLRFLSTIYALPRQQRRERVEQALETYDLRDLQHQFSGTMSGGQRQRLALAAATLHQPELLILDEPTSGVDPQSRRDFWDRLFDLVGHGTTVLLSTHYLDEAERCHQLAILNEGQLVAEGAPAELMNTLDAQVVEIDTSEALKVRHELSQHDQVQSVAQLGTRLHALLDNDIDDPVAEVTRWLKDCDDDIEVSAVSANLEDVFVAATENRQQLEPET